MCKADGKSWVVAWSSGASLLMAAPSADAGAPVSQAQAYEQRANLLSLAA